MTSLMRCLYQGDQVLDAVALCRRHLNFHNLQAVHEDEDVRESLRLNVRRETLLGKLSVNVRVGPYVYMAF